MFHTVLRSVAKIEGGFTTPSAAAAESVIVVIVVAAALAPVAELAEVLEIEAAATIVFAAEAAVLVAVALVAPIAAIVGLEQAPDPAEQPPGRTLGRFLVSAERVEQIIEHQGYPFRVRASFPLGTQNPSYIQTDEARV